MSERIDVLPGFKKVGHLRSKAGVVELLPIADRFTRDAAVYAFVVDKEVRYIGSAESLADRLRSYRRRQIRESSKRTVHTKIRKALSDAHEIEIFAFVIQDRPIKCDGLPVDPLIGIEAGLIMTLKPTWNRRGVVFTVEAPEP
jgi:hypothetical protein